MSQTRITCEKCGIAMCWCQCHKVAENIKDKEKLSARQFCIDITRCSDGCPFLIGKCAVAYRCGLFMRILHQDMEGNPPFRDQACKEIPK